VARRHSWSSRIVARGLEQLSRGASYAEVGRWALRVGGTPAGSSPSPVLDPLLDPEVEPLLEPASAQDPESGSGISGRSAAGAAVTAPATVDAALDPDAPPVKKRRRVSPSSKASHSAWHVAAGWTEAFAPVVYADVEQRLRHGAVTERARLDARLAAGRPLDRPQVLLLDELPVYGREIGGSGKARRDDGSMSWSPPKSAGTRRSHGPGLKSGPLMPPRRPRSPRRWLGASGCGWCGHWPRATPRPGGCCSTSWATHRASSSPTPGQASLPPSRRISTRPGPGSSPRCGMSGTPSAPALPTPRAPSCRSPV